MHDLLALLEALPSVCEDKAWLGAQSGRLVALAETTASKFDCLDSFTLARLVIALAKVRRPLP